MQARGAWPVGGYFYVRAGESAAATDAGLFLEQLATELVPDYRT
ncbi:hypothetical protein AB1484_17720 [Parafrankia sp. FMc6]